ncbi:MAG TPA: hypothetical protein VH251_01720, partial [Verrucomicrobiae bacterium]|nr:hypothetical protein [Verrucomicrobiae bacterium]
MKNETMGDIPENVSSEFNSGPASMRSVVFAVLAVWLGLISFLGYQGAFVGRAGSPPLGIFLGVTVPLVVFFAAYRGWGAFRAFVLGADLRFVTAIQAWRWGGLGFLSLYAHGVLPGLFAFPAGLGDMAVGITAPWIMLRLIRNPSFAASRRFVIWNIMGIADFVVAVSMGTICSGFVPGLALNVTTSALAQLPLVLIPAYMVPIFAM